MVREDDKEIREANLKSKPKKQENKVSIRNLFLEEQERFNRNTFIVGLFSSNVVVLLFILSFLDMILDFIDFPREEMYILIELGILLLVGIFLLGIGSKNIQSKIKESEEVFPSKLLVKTGTRILIVFASLVLLLFIVILIIFGWRFFLFLFFGIGD
jgi:hypothetical protein